jgi:SMC interacting uncharacterized protein involved in chromosome segregation
MDTFINNELETINKLNEEIEKLKKSNEELESLKNLNDEIENVKKLNQQINRITDTVDKHNIDISKNTHQVFTFNRDLTETKDILKSFMLKYDSFTHEITQNLSDYEIALSDIEKNLNINNDTRSDDEISSQKSNIGINEIYQENNTIISSDLKSLIKQELANS